MIDHGKPIYQFKIKRKDASLLRLIGGVFSVVGLLFFFLNLLQIISGSCQLNEESVSCKELYPFCFIAAFGVGFGVLLIFFSRRIKSEIINCYSDGIESSYYGFISRDKLSAIDFFQYFGSKTRGTIWIKTNVYLKSVSERQYVSTKPAYVNAYILTDIPNVENTYEQIKSFYNLPHEDFRSQIKMSYLPLAQYHDKKILNSYEISPSRIMTIKGKKEFNKHTNFIIGLFLIFLLIFIIIFTSFLYSVK